MRQAPGSRRNGRSSLFTFCIAFALLVLTTAVRADDPRLERITPDSFARTAFLGDSITDGNTFPCLVRDALTGSDVGKMVVINAGIGGDTARGMRARLERDVLSFHPTLVTLSAGANDALRDVSPIAYEQDVRAVAKRLRQEHIPLILLTPSVLGPKMRGAQKNLDAYEVVLRKLARELDLRLAEVNARQKQEQAQGKVVLAADDLHPNYEGQRMIARAVLDSMGYADVKVPRRVHNQPLPGLVTPWKVKPLGEKDGSLTDAVVTGLKPDDSWRIIELPEKEPDPGLDSPDDRWLDDYRQMGVCVSPRRREPGSSRFVAVTTVHSDEKRTVQFHTGAELNALWLNGRLIYKNDGSRGWHPGRESVTATLEKGENTLFAQTGNVFFLSITDGPIW